MEFLFELLFEIFGEFFLQIVFEVLASAGLHFVRNTDQGQTSNGSLKLVFGYALMGAMAGGLSLLVFSGAFVHSHTAKVANLIITPLLSGAAMAGIGLWRQRRGQVVVGLDRFFYGFVFAFAMAGIRFLWAN